MFAGVDQRRRSSARGRRFGHEVTVEHAERDRRAPFERVSCISMRFNGQSNTSRTAEKNRWTTTPVMGVKRRRRRRKPLGPWERS